MEKNQEQWVIFLFISEKDFKILSEDEFTQHWFLEYDYSDETEKMFDELNN